MRMQSGPYLLALETATPVGSVSVWEGRSMLGYVEIRQEKAHARLLLPVIDGLMGNLGLRPAQLGAVAVGKGPGSYTGLRVGVSTAKGLCLSLGIPLIGIGSLEGLAAQVQDLARSLGAAIAPVIDARRMEAYSALYSAELGELAPVDARIFDAESFSGWLAARPLILVGDAAAKLLPLAAGLPGVVVLPEVQATAAGIGKLAVLRFEAGQFEDLERFEPYYLKEFAVRPPRDLLAGT